MPPLVPCPACLMQGLKGLLDLVPAWPVPVAAPMAAAFSVAVAVVAAAHHCLLVCPLRLPAPPVLTKGARVPEHPCPLMLPHHPR